jgi:hypothetical protein
MSSIHPPPDSRGHMPDCKHFGEPPSADEDNGYADLFCECHNWETPRILPGGINIAWPAGWRQEQAADWRQKNNLAPSSEPGPGPDHTNR